MPHSIHLVSDICLIIRRTQSVPDPVLGSHRLRLENYACFEEGLQGLASRVPALDHFQQQAAQKKEASLLVYIQQQLEYAKMWKLLEFSQVQIHTSCVQSTVQRHVCKGAHSVFIQGGGLALMEILINVYSAMNSTPVSKPPAETTFIMEGRSRALVI